MKRIFIVSILICVLIIPLAPGCGLFWHESPPAEPITVELSFPNDAPPLNTEAELNCIVKAPAISLTNMSVEIRLPEAFELVSGDLSWTGDINQGAEVEVISAVVRAIKTGNWAIELRSSIDPEEQGGLSFYPDWRDAIYVSISEDSAEWGIYPPWYKGGGHEVPVKVVDETSSPIVDLSISHVPLVNETAEITCTLTTLIDYSDMNAQIVLTYGDDLALVDGSLEWHGDLAANVPATFSALVAFTRSDVYVIGWRVWQTGKESTWLNPGLICLNIGEEESSFCEEPTLIFPSYP
jgi:hypothetical protein